jgi:hypothetical protein
MLTPLWFWKRLWYLRVGQARISGI